MIKIREAIVVEGRYDRNTLSQVVDAPIFETSGFGIRKNPEQMALLRQVAQRRGLIILTDGDGAGMVIRNFLKGAIDPALVKHAYIPDVFGKERRKSAPGKEGKLGVEGMRPEVLIEALRRAGATLEGESEQPRNELTGQDFFDLGLTGQSGSEELRHALQKKLGFPEKMSPKALRQSLTLLYTRQELEAVIAPLRQNGENDG